MSSKRKIEIFGARCSACNDVVAMVKRIGCSLCDVDVLDMRDPAVAAKSKSYGVRTVPAIAIDGRLAACCTAMAPTKQV
jgi:glutaredoxin